MKIKTVPINPRITGRLLLFLGVLFCAPDLNPVAAASEAPTRADLKAIYNYHPHLQSNEEMQQNSNRLDALWKKAEEDKDNYVPLLRTELQKPDHVPFFYFDAGSLLIRLTGASSDKKLFLSSLRYVDLRDIQNTAYLRTVHGLALEGFDTSDAALNILKYPEFKAIIPVHVLTLGQDFSLIYMLFPLEDEQFIDKVISALAKETNATSLKSLMMVMWYSVTDKGWEALRSAAMDLHYSKEHQQYALKLLERNRVESDSYIFSSSHSIKNKRRKALRRISDEALIEFDQYTLELLMKKNSITTKTNYQIGPFNVIVQSPIATLFAVIPFILMGVYIVYLIQFINYFSTKHPDKWEQMWSKIFPLNYFIINEWRLARFIWNQKYLEIDDSRVQCYGKMLRRLTFAVLWYLLGIIVFVWARNNF